MDGLRLLARQDLDERLEFVEARSSRNLSGEPLHLIRILEGQDQEPPFELVSEKDMLRELEADSLPKAEAEKKSSLVLAVITRENTKSIHISKEAFLRIFELFCIDPYVLHIISFGTTGLHHYPGLYRSRYTYHIGTFLYIIVWSFDPETSTTKAILLPRTNFWGRRGIDPVQDFGRILQTYRRLLYTPFLLIFSALVHINRKLDELFIIEATVIRRTEMATLKGSHGLSKSGVDIDQLSHFARLMEDSLSHLSNHMRHFKLTQQLIQFLQDLTRCAPAHHKVLDEMKVKYDEDLNVFKSALGTIRSQSEGKMSGITYWKERARNQYSVIFAILTHEDARNSIKQAEATRQVAEATKADASSMKTIAVMTMAFLPGTFFAALFAVPSLRWDNQLHVVQDNFWVYWAFTLPTTVLVFALWQLLTRTNVRENCGCWWWVNWLF